MEQFPAYYLLDWAISSQLCLFFVKKFVIHIFSHYTHLNSLLQSSCEVSFGYSIMDCHVSNLLEYYPSIFPTNTPTTALWRNRPIPLFTLTSLFLFT